MDSPDDPRAPDAVAGIVRELLDLIARIKGERGRRATPDTRFSDLGLDSLDAASVAGEVERRWGIALDPAELFDDPTPTDLARIIIQRRTAS